MKKTLIVASMMLSGIVQAQSTSCQASIEAFNCIQDGMTYNEVRRIIGCDGSLLSTSSMAGYTTTMYGWSGKSGFLQAGANMNLMVQNGKVVMKAQFGLKSSTPHMGSLCLPAITRPAPAPPSVRPPTPTPAPTTAPAPPRPQPPTPVPTTQIEALQLEQTERMARLTIVIERGNTQQAAGPSASYAGRVGAKLKPNITLLEETRAHISGNPVAEVEVRAGGDGSITDRKLIKSSGVKAWDDAVLRAIDKSESLPRDIDGRVPPLLVISFSMKD